MTATAIVAHAGAVIKMDPVVAEALGIQKELKSHIVLNGDLFHCYHWHRDDHWSEPKLRFPMQIPRENVAKLAEVIRANWTIPIVPLTRDVKSIPEVCKFTQPQLVPLIIEKFGLQYPDGQPLHPDTFVAKNTLYRAPYYTWPMTILQAFGVIRFGRCSWLLK